MLTPEVEAIVIRLAKADERSVAFMIRKLIEDSPAVKAALRKKK